VQLSGADPEAKLRALKADLELETRESKGFGGGPKGRPGKAAAAAAEEEDTAAIAQEDKKWVLRAHDVAEWGAWIDELKVEKGVTSGNVFIQARSGRQTVQVQLNREDVV